MKLHFDYRHNYLLIYAFLKVSLCDFCLSDLMLGGAAGNESTAVRGLREVSPQHWQYHRHMGSIPDPLESITVIWAESPQHGQYHLNMGSITDPLGSITATLAVSPQHGQYHGSFGKYHHQMRKITATLAVSPVAGILPIRQ